MVQLSPDTRTVGWDASPGYHYSDSSILGFSHTHLSGTGIGHYGDVLFMPVTGNPGLLREMRRILIPDFAQGFPKVPK
jgi:putative alpha-1,2-mannosidase